MVFKRTVEDFVCAHCATDNRGDGYTNHCYRCLYSKHVDTEPGDRANRCGGLMPPVGVLVKGGRYTLLHRCATCGHEQKCRTSPRDDRDAILAAAAQAWAAVDTGGARGATGRGDQRRQRLH